ncbi:sigma-54 dependent transcriptional regulator [Fodinicurvata sp. EGI_FJ10296]|uniref:sigma-54-dependent transcriptional regulator n=1 Tax=Fodinicurvata sp. EGI_FJ10296 TaxID=3231908 RepID=UPI003455EFED
MRLLIVGTLSGHISTAGKIAKARGARVAFTDTVSQAMTALRNGDGADLLMVDVALDVASLIDQLKAERFHVPVVACGIGSDARSAVKSIQAGAKEYIPLPPDADLIAAVLEAVAAESHSIVTGDPAMAAVLRLADQVAGSDASVLINGESGTGKELIARYLHRKSRRSDKKFISVNCAAIPEHLLESELFGHEKGAFTGAVSRRVGKFEEAHGGTLLLDEISEMDPRLQAKLLRAIQEREIDRVGGTAPVKIDIRVLATTNRTLEDEVRKGTFREDLYYRLNVVSLPIPPLRDRPGDILPLADHFVAKYAEANATGPKALSDAARDMLTRHSWPGNVRDLENTMHRAVLLSSGATIEPEAISPTSAIATGPRRTPDADADAANDRPAANARSQSGAESGAQAGGQSGRHGETAVADQTPATRGSGMVGRTVAEVERDLIIETLEHTLGNRTHAATILGISIRTLRNKLKLYSREGVAIPPAHDTERAAV